jgi:hypothetical protein
MRKGILSLSGRGKAASRKKTGNMANAEQAAERKAAAREEPKAQAGAQEKPFVQTIQVPKQPSAQKGTKRRGLLGGMGRRRPQGKK